MGTLLSRQRERRVYRPPHKSGEMLLLPACPEISSFNDFTNTSIWTIASGVVSGYSGGPNVNSVLISQTVEVGKLSVTGTSDSFDAPGNDGDKVVLQADATFPMSLAVTCPFLNIRGKFRQPSLSFTPATAPGFFGTCPLNTVKLRDQPISPPASEALATIWVHTSVTNTIYLQQSRSLFATWTNAACAAAGRQYQNLAYNLNPVPPTTTTWEDALDGHDSDFLFKVDLSSTPPGEDILLQFRLMLHNAPFTGYPPGPVLYSHYYETVMTALTEVNNVNFFLSQS